MKRILSVSMIVLFVLSVFSILVFAVSEPPPTEWDRTYGGTNEDEVYSVVQTFDGGYALAGYTNSFGAGNADFWLVKTDWTGNMMWNKTYGGTEDDLAECVVETGDGGYALAGNTKSFGAGNEDFWFVRTDSAGNMIWNKTYGGTEYERIYSIVQTVDGGYALAGYTNSFGAGNYDSWLVKTDAYGNHEWNQTYGGTGTDYGYSVVQTDDGGYAITGRTNSFGAGNYDSWLVKTDSAGSMLWNKTYGGAGDDRGKCVVKTCDCGYALAGFTSSFGAGSYDFWLVKTDAYGNMTWNSTYGKANYDVAYSVVETGDGGYALAGHTYSFGAGTADFWLVKTNSTGNMQWNTTYGGANRDCGYSVVETGDGGYALAGYTYSFGAGNEDFWLIKLAPEEIPATVDIDPDSLNLRSRGRWITAYIELPEGYDVNDINVSTILLNDTVPAELHPTEVGDYDDDGIPDLMVKFDRDEVISYIQSNLNTRERVCTATLTITGKLYDGTPFQGRDSIRVLISRKGDPIPR